MLNITSPIAGAAGIAGFTSPTYTLTTATVSFPYSRMQMVTAKGGTQPSAVDVHSASRPFTFLSTRPAVIRAMPPLNANGQLVGNPKNTYHVRSRKGVTVLAGQPSETIDSDFSFSIPAGAELLDPDNLKAWAIAKCAAIQSLVQGIIDTASTGEN